MNRSLILFAFMLLSACAQSNTPSEGSQTHFLEPCTTSCPAPYACLANACTLECDDDGDCSEQPAGARCIDAACDVECMDESDCSALSEDHACESGRCRAPTASGGMGGQGGSGGSSGTSGEGGMGGSGGATMDVDSGYFEPLCDGSRDIRFAMTNGGGFVDVSYEFTNPYGHSFLFVDGQCNFYISTHHMRGIRTGKLTNPQAAAFASDVGWDRIEEWSESMVEDPGCPDGSTMVLQRDQYATSCTCGCRPEFSPADKIDAFAAVSEWMETIDGISAPLEGDVSAIGYADANIEMREPLEWPLDRSVMELDFLGPQGEVLLANPARFQGADAEMLKLLRETAAMRPGGDFFVPVVNEGTYYAIFIRDELPEDVLIAVEALLARPL